MNAAINPKQHPGPRVEDDLRAVEREEDDLRQVEAEHEGDQTQLKHDLLARSRPPLVHDVQMNYHPLTLRGQRLTGLQIKEQAITAGIPHIQPHFHLTVERAGKDAEHTVGDNEKWAVRNGDCFTAVKPDDNS